METFSLFDVSTAIANLMASGNGQVGIYNDLGTGASFAAQSVSAANNGQIVPVNLNAAGLAALNAARGGQMAVGGAVTTIAGTINQSIFAGTGLANDVKQLVLTLAEPADWYSIDVADIANALRIETSTPADGPGQFVNTLNPRIELFDPAGNLVASGIVAADGRNEFLEYQPLTTGAYRVRVSGEGNTTRRILPDAELQPGGQCGRDFAYRRKRFGYFDRNNHRSGRPRFAHRAY